LNATGLEEFDFDGFALHEQHTAANWKSGVQSQHLRKTEGSQ
jgi:hypothetical protein